jgi:hypothetical protein
MWELLQPDECCFMRKAGSGEDRSLELTRVEDIDAGTFELAAALRDAQAQYGKWRPPPPRADELARSLGHNEVIWRRLEYTEAGGIEGVSRVARRALAGLTSTRLLGPTYGDLLAVVVAFRNLSAWEQIIKFVEDVSALYSRDGVPFARLHPVAQQYGMALNRRGSWLKAENLLTTLVAVHGPDAETLGILGRVYKDRWRRSGADRHLFRSIDVYARGLLSNPGELYPAINLLTLLWATGAGGAGFEAVATHLWKLFDERQRVGPGDYFDYATAVEFHALFGREYDANLMLDEALQRVRASWELETTAANLGILLSGSKQRPFVEAFLRRLHAEAARNRGLEKSTLSAPSPTTHSVESQIGR